MSHFAQFRRPAKLYLKTLMTDRLRFARVNLIQGMITLCNLAFPIVLSVLFAVLIHTFGGSEASQGLPNFVVDAIQTANPSVLSVALLGFLFVLDVARNFLQLTLQTELDAQASSVYSMLANSAVENYLGQDLLFRSKYSSHRLQSLLTQLLFAAKGLQTGLIGRVIPTAVEALLALGIVVTLFGPAYLLLFGGLLASFVCFSFIFSKSTDRAQQNFQRTFSGASASIGDALALHDQIVSFGGKRKALQDVAKATSSLHGSQIVALKSHRRFSSLQSATIYAFAYAILGLLVYHILSGSANVAALVLLTTYIFQFTAPLNTIGFFIRDAVRHLSVIAEVQSSFMPDDGSTCTAENVQMFINPSKTPSIVCANILYSSPDAKFTLDVDKLELKGLKDIALVGPNGSGKSTLARILAGHIVPTSGNVLVNGNSIAQLTPDLRADLVRYVPQSGQLFKKDMLYNLTFPKDIASCDRNILEKILTDLQANEKLKDKLSKDTDPMTPLSGGEVQKVLLARALLNTAPIMILDEAASDLDVISSAKVRETLRKWCPDCLIIYITHAPDFARSCDEAISLHGGRVCAHGDVADVFADEGFWMTNAGRASS